jgi:hypothetical protein
MNTVWGIEPNVEAEKNMTFYAKYFIQNTSNKYFVNPTTKINEETNIGFR